MEESTTNMIGAAGDNHKGGSNHNAGQGPIEEDKWAA
jgi:hypothetical protein